MTAGDRLGHYTIVSFLGAGGMGAVYRATDTTLHRDVALKVLPNEVASDPERLERFRREARALAALSHPHVVTVYSVEQADGVHFLTMELVTGRSLDTVTAEHPLPIERVVQVGLAVADALGAAHARGIVHRDLKPANVIIGDSGSVKVLDFGLAKVQPSGPAGGQDAATYLATGAGQVLGTPAYMSPEQVSGLDVDHRADIFSLGVLLYEMATGVRPFRGQSAAELAASILRDTPRPASDVMPTVTVGLANAIARCLQKDASARFPTMADVRQALEGTTQAPAAKTPSIAVMPFRNLSADADGDFFSDGLAEEILNALTQIDGLRVAARASSFSFKGKAAEPSEIGAKLRVATVLDGSVRRAGNRIRVTAQLVDVSNGFQLWSERYDRELADIFDVQDEIARAIATRLTLTLEGAARLVKSGTSNLQAYELYLRGRALLLKRGRHAAEAGECLQRAVDLDPGFAPAWAGLADMFTVRAYHGLLAPKDSMPHALAAARRAVALDPLNAEAHGALAMALLLWERDYDGAEAAFRRSVELNPTYTQARAWHGLFSLQWIRGLHDEGVAEVRRAYDGDPLSAYAASILGMTLACAGQTEDGMALARLGAERDPDANLGHWVHGLVAHWSGALHESVEAFDKALAVSGRGAMSLAHKADVCADLGRQDDARALHQELVEMSTRTYVPNALLAISTAAVGDRDRAFELLQKAIDERETLIVLIARLAPNLRRLRDDPRFADVLRRLALPD